MNTKQEHHAGLPSISWLIVLLIGFGFAWGWIRAMFEGLATRPVQWDMIGGSLVNIAVIFIPFVIVAWILRAGRTRKMPSLAFVVTLISGVFFFLFSLAELIGGLIPPYDASETVGGLLQIATFALPFFIVAWLLWIKPKIGAALLVLVGVAMAIWIAVSWNLPASLDAWLMPMVLAGLPIILGAYTFIKETLSGNADIKLRNAA